MSPRLSASAKTGIGVAVVLVALMAALLTSVLGDDGPSSGAASAESPAGATSAPQQSGSSGTLAGLTLDDLDDGAPVDLAAATAGRPAVINLWAYWCGPCREELPAMAEYAQRAGDAVTVLAVHSDPHSGKGRALLQDLGVHLTALADPDRSVATAVGAPQVLPVTVLVRADGTIAKVVAVPFTDADQIASVVADTLGVTL